MENAILVVDQGTTSTRAIVFDEALEPIAVAQKEFSQVFPRPGWVEHDPESIWRSVQETVREAVARAARRIVAVGIANQRETTLVWDRRTGEPIHNAIVWQDRRTAPACDRLRKAGVEDEVARKTGLLLDPYFSATKIAWLLDNVAGARERAERGELVFGTVDTFLIHRMTGGARHVTDATNASRTALFDIEAGRWDEDLAALFGVQGVGAPDVLDCAAEFGLTREDALGFSAPILGVAGDQQAALIGQGCFTPGLCKSTYGTGAFLLLSTGETRIASRNRLLSTIAMQAEGRRLYALEGSIFSAGSVVQWLRDGLGIIQTSAEAGELAARADPDSGVHLVPAFTGLGAPVWDSEARALISGLTRGAGRREIGRAALESVGFQTRDLIEAMRDDAGTAFKQATLRVDGGLSASDFAMQFLADILGAPVERPQGLETTALGAAFLAAWKLGWSEGPEAFAGGWRAERRFEPEMAEEERERRYAGWGDALARCSNNPTLRAKRSNPAAP